MKKLICILSLIQFYSAARAIQAETTQEISAVLPVRPDTAFSLLYADSNSLQGSDYSSFADIVNSLAGVYHYDSHSMGVPAPVSPACSPPGEFTLEYDGLILNDPVNGKADVYLIPTESMGTAGLEQGLYQHFSTGQTVRITSQDRSYIPLHSKIAYRPGTYQRNQFDVRLGVQINPTTDFNAGALTRAFGGVMPHSAYRSTIWNAKLDKHYKHASLSYLWYQYSDHQRFPLKSPLPGWQSLEEPHRKRFRNDHALFLRSGNFRASAQLTLYDRNDFGSDRSQLDQSHTVRRLYVKTAYQDSISRLGYGMGLFGRFDRFQSDTWKDIKDSQYGGWLHVSARLKNLTGEAGFNVKTQSQHSFLLPQLRIRLKTGEKSALSVYAGQNILRPSIEERHGRGPFATGNDSLKAATLTHTGLNWQINRSRFQILAGMAVQHRKHLPVAVFDHDKIQYNNFDAHTCGSMTIALNYQPTVHWGAHARLLFYQDVSDSFIAANRPDLYSRFYISYQNIFFQRDLNLMLRLGGEYIGYRKGPVPVYSEYSDITVTLSPRIIPYAHISATIGRVDLFAVIENPAGWNFQQVYGFDTPRALIRYGIVWTFDD